MCGKVSGNPSVVPGVKLQEEDGDEEELAGEDLTRYRSVVATANFISQDRPVVRFAVKELCREMATPTCASWRKLKKLARYGGQPGSCRRSSSMWMGLVTKSRLCRLRLGIRLGRMLADEKKYERWMYHGR